MLNASFNCTCEVNKYSFTCIIDANLSYSGMIQAANINTLNSMLWFTHQQSSQYANVMEARNQSQ